LNILWNLRIINVIIIIIIIINIIIVVIIQVIADHDLDRQTSHVTPNSRADWITDDWSVNQIKTVSKVALMIKIITPSCWDFFLFMSISAIVQCTSASYFNLWTGSLVEDRAEYLE